jgi:hypothetical protein
MDLKFSFISEEYFKDSNFKTVYIDSSYKIEWYDRKGNRYISLRRESDTFKTSKETLPFEASIPDWSTQWDLYVNSDNKCYSKLPNSDTLEWTDGSLYHDSILSMHVNKNVTRLLGYTCGELVIICTNGVKQFYYSPINFKVNSKQFIKYKSGNWTDFLLIANSLPLMQIEHRDKLYTEIVAIKAEEMKLNNGFFTVPGNLIISKVGH